jgi:hypothetical protein
LATALVPGGSVPWPPSDGRPARAGPTSLSTSLRKVVVQHRLHWRRENRAAPLGASIEALEALCAIPAAGLSMGVLLIRYQRKSPRAEGVSIASMPATSDT